MSDRRLMVRMAEKAVSSALDDVLVSLGLGSCIGLALIDESAGVAGLVHIVLPRSPVAGAGSTPAKFADSAVPLLLEEVLGAGGRQGHLRAVVCGGAHMFGGGSANSLLQIGARNAEATLVSLEELRIPVRGTDTGGSVGRSVEVQVASGSVSVRSVGQSARRL